MLQLTDGTVMVQDQGPDNSGTGNWWRLTPNRVVANGIASDPVAVKITGP